MASTIQQLRNLHILIYFALCTSLVIAGCPDRCTCSKYTTTCIRAMVKSLPTKLPTTTQYLRIEEDYIAELNETVLTRVALQNLTCLGLYKVNLQHIEPGSFKGMGKLEQLHIVNNSIRVLKTDTFKGLDTLYLLELSYNHILNFEDGAFSGLPNIRYLDMSDRFSMPMLNSLVRMRQTNDCILTDIPVLGYLFREQNIAFLKYMCTLTFFRVGNHAGDLLSLQNFVQNGMKTVFSSKHPYFIFKNTNVESSGISYLDMQNSRLGNLRRGWFQNLTNLTYLGLGLNGIAEIENGTFEELISLRTLILSSNNLESVNNETFRGLTSLKTLDISHCKIRTIESGAFRVLSKLQIMELSSNDEGILKQNIFASHSEVQELQSLNNRLDSSFLNKSIHYHTYTDIFIYRFGSKLNICENKWYFLLGDNRVAGLHETQLFTDMVGKEFCKLTSNLAHTLLRSLHLYINVTSIESLNDIQQLPFNTQHITELELTLIDINSTETLSNFSAPQVSTLNLFFRDLNNVYNIGKLSGFPNLKSLLIHGFSKYSLPNTQISYVVQLTSISKLRLNYDRRLYNKVGGIIDLGILPLTSLNSGTLRNAPLKCIDKQMFFGLNNLEQLILKNNSITCIKAGSFQGLQNIKQIDIAYNYINILHPGIFGAQCVDNLQTSCENVTSTEYCNSTDALKTLQILDLSHNNLSYIHPYSFVSCTKLQALYLSYNKFLTLNNQFLFAPALTELYMIDCNITQIPSNTFLCSPLLSVIEFQNNNISNLSLDTVLPLKKLLSIDLSKNDSYFPCSCNLHETWIWLRERRVGYTINCSDSEGTLFSWPGNVDKVLSAMNCSTSTLTSNKTNVTKSTRHDFALFKRYTEPVFLIIIFILGLISNGFLLFVALRHSDMRTTHNIISIHLAVVDILSLTLNLPLSYWDVLNISWEFDDTTCKIFIFSKDVLVAATVFSMVCLGVERFLIAKMFNDLKNGCVTKIIPRAWLLFMTWISAVVLSLPAYYSATVDIRCLYCPPGNKDYIRNVWTFQLIMYCLLPTAALAFFNIKTSVFLRESFNKIPGEQKDNTLAKNRITVANIVLVSIFIFIISYLPNYTLRVLVAWSVVDIENVFMEAFVTYCLYFCITVFNPISVFIMNSKLKSRALSYFPFLEK